MNIENGSLPTVPVMDECEKIGQHYGLTKREHFAAMAMQGYLANSLIIDSCTNVSVDYIASSSIEFADALLKELAK